MRNLFSVALCLVAGLFLNAAGLLSFLRDPALADGKWWIASGFFGLACVPLFVAVWLTGFRHWRTMVGAVLLACAALLTLTVFTQICLRMDETFNATFPTHALALFGDYVSGGIVVLWMAGLGAWLFSSGDASKP